MPPEPTSCPKSDPSPEASFRELLQRISQGSEDAAWQLVESYGEGIRRAVRRSLHGQLRSKFDSLDFVQIVWGSFFRVRDKLDRFNRPEELAAYLATMARNKVGMEVRRRLILQKHNVNRERPLDGTGEDAAIPIADRQPAPIDVAIARERWNRMLEGQPDRYRQVIELRLQGHTHQAIATRLSLDECTVRRFLKRLLHEVAE